MLGRAVGGDVGVALEPRRGGDEDDAPPRQPRAAADVGQRRSDRQERAGQVDVEHALPVGEVDLGDRRTFRRPGIGDEDVDGAVRGSRGHHHGAGVRLAGDVGDDGLGARQTRRDLLERPGAAARERDGGARAGQASARWRRRCRCRRR